MRKRLGKRSTALCTWCQKPNDRQALLCYDCRLKALEWAKLAVAQVAVAIKRGQLPHPATLICVDCGRPAQCYDHRLYSAPQQVQPVCYSCNVKRGSAFDLLNPTKPA